MLLILFLINTSGDDSFVWFSSCFSVAGALQPAERSTRRRGCSPHAQPCLQCSVLGHSCSPPGALYVTLGMPAIRCAEKWSPACLLAFFFFPLHFYLFIYLFSLFSLSEGLHHLPVFHSLGSRGKEWNKSTCCFYQVNLCDVARSEEFYILFI